MKGWKVAGGGKCDLEWCWGFLFFLLFNFKVTRKIADCPSRLLLIRESKHVQHAMTGHFAACRMYAKRD